MGFTVILGDLQSDLDLSSPACICRWSWSFPVLVSWPMKNNLPSRLRKLCVKHVAERFVVFRWLRWLKVDLRWSRPPLAPPSGERIRGYKKQRTTESRGRNKHNRLSRLPPTRSLLFFRWDGVAMVTERYSRGGSGAMPWLAEGSSMQQQKCDF